MSRRRRGFLWSRSRRWRRVDGLERHRHAIAANATRETPSPGTMKTPSRYNTGPRSKSARVVPAEAASLLTARSGQDREFGEGHRRGHGRRRLGVGVARLRASRRLKTTPRKTPDESPSFARRGVGTETARLGRGPAAGRASAARRREGDSRRLRTDTGPQTDKVTNGGISLGKAGRLR